MSRHYRKGLECTRRLVTPLFGLTVDETVWGREVNPPSISTYSTVGSHSNVRSLTGIYYLLRDVLGMTTSYRDC